MTDVDILQGGRMKQDDTLPPLQVQLIGENEKPFNLNGMSDNEPVVNFKIQRSDGSNLSVDADSDTSTVTIRDAERGIVEYDWQAGDTSDQGTFLLEVVATDSDDSEPQATFPNKGRATIYVTEGL